MNRSAVSGRQPRTEVTRLVVRQISEVLLARSRRWQALVPQETGVVFEIVLGASIAHLPVRDPGSGRWIGLDDAITVVRPVSATATAQSIGVPVSTVRRHAAKLVEVGLVAKTATGLRPAMEFFADARLAELTAADARDLVRVVSSLASDGHEPSVRAMNAGFSLLPPGVVARATLAFALRALETITGLYGDVTAGTIMASIIAANVRHVTEDAVRARRYAAEDTPLPDASRRPVTLRSLSRALDMPFETVRRRVTRLIEKGFVVSSDAGVIVPGGLLDERVLADNRRLQTHFDQMLNSLAALDAAGARFRHR